MHFSEDGSQAAAVSRDGIQETDLRAFCLRAISLSIGQRAVVLIRQRV